MLGVRTSTHFWGGRHGSAHILPQALAAPRMDVVLTHLIGEELRALMLK